MADLRLFASTSNLIRFILKHSTTGQGLTGLSSASSGLIISTICDNEATATAYTAAGSTIETITTLGTFATPTATKCRFKEVDATNHKGLYEFQFADARFAITSAKRLVISVTGATNLLDADYEIQLVRFDPYDSVRLGLTALPNAAAEAAGGLYTRGTGAGQINQPANGMIDTNPVRWNGTAVATPHTAGYPVVTIKDGTGTGEIDTNAGAVVSVTSVSGAVGSVTGNVGGNVTGSVGSVASGGIAASSFAAGAIDAAAIATDAIGANEFSQAAADKVWSSTTRTLSAFGFSVTVGTNNDKTGYALSTAGVQAIWDALTSALTTVGSIGKRLADDIDATISSRSSHTAADIWAVATRVLTSGANIVLAKGTGVTGFNDLDAAGVRSAVGLASANLDTQLTTIDDFLDTEIAAIKAKTDNLPSDPADASDIAASFSTVNTKLDTIDDFIDTEVAAIKAKTDQLTFTTANKVDATIQAAGDFAQAAADKVWLTASRTLTAFGFSVTVGTNSDKTGYSLSTAGVQAIWDALTSALTTTGSIGKLLVDNINATILSRSSHTAADVWSVATRLLTAGTNIVLAKGVGVTGFNDLSAAEVNTEASSAVVDALSVDTYAEPGQEAPPATTTLVKKIGYLYKLARNRKTQTTTTLSLYADNGTTVDQKATISDDGTVYTHGELGTGP